MLKENRIQLQSSVLVKDCKPARNCLHCIGFPCGHFLQRVTVLLMYIYCFADGKLTELLIMYNESLIVAFIL